MSISDWFIAKEDCDCVVGDADPRNRIEVREEDKSPKMQPIPLGICVGLLRLSSPHFFNGQIPHFVKDLKEVTKYNYSNTFFLFLLNNYSIVFFLTQTQRCPRSLA